MTERMEGEKGLWYPDLEEALMGGWLPGGWVFDLLREEYDLGLNRLTQDYWELAIKKDRTPLLVSTPVAVGDQEWVPPGLRRTFQAFFHHREVEPYLKVRFLRETAFVVGHVRKILRARGVYLSAGARTLGLDGELRGRLVPSPELLRGYARALLLWGEEADWKAFASFQAFASFASSVEGHLLLKRAVEGSRGREKALLREVAFLPGLFSLAQVFDARKEEEGV